VAKMMGTLPEDLCKFMIMSRSVLLRMRNVSDVVEKIEAHFVANNFPFNPPPENRTVGKKMWRNRVQPDRPQITIQYGACIFNVG
jgi:hypothetical protein